VAWRYGALGATVCQLLLQLLAAFSSAAGKRSAGSQAINCACSGWLSAAAVPAALSGHRALAHVLFDASYDAEDLVLVATAKAIAVVRRVCGVGGVLSTVTASPELGTLVPRQQHAW
jgi:hypothetical protein